MSIWQFVKRVTASATSGVGSVVEAVRTVFGGDPELRRRVAFSVAMIALSAKMAKADGIVTHDEIRAFQQIFEIPFAERKNVARLYDLAKKDVAGFEAYAERMAGLCGSGNRNCAVLEDILDGLSTSPRPTVFCMSAKGASCTASRRSSASRKATTRASWRAMPISATPIRG